jgi:phage-related protein
MFSSRKTINFILAVILLLGISLRLYGLGSEGIWEIRIRFGNNIYRLLGFFANGTLIILTNGFAKKTQKTPSREIALAIHRKKDYLARRIKS